MTDFLTRTTGTLLVFGFFFALTGCSSKVYTLEQAEETFDSGDYRKALEKTSRLLRDDPDNESLHFLNARILMNIAIRQERPETRLDYYREMEYSLNQISASEWIQESDNLRNHVWDEEYGAAERLFAQEDAGSFSHNFRPVIAHLENALQVQPDNPKAHNLKATAYYRNGDLQLAVETLQTAYNQFDHLPVEMKEKLAFLLLEEGQLEKSIDLYRTLLDENPENIDVKHGLINAYILNEQHDASIELLRGLLETDQENITYHEALATELFFYIQSSVNEMAEGDFSDEELLARHEQLMADLDEAENHYQFVQENHTNPAEITFITAAFYKNTANHLITLANFGDSELSERFKDKANELLSRSVPIWEQVAERNPENPEIWKSMFQIYSQLDMTEEAEEARSKANM
jgi:tetratricopeptide (TPR) repeat protein